MIHIYTGDGKGKTTAAIGLAIRGIGVGKKTAIIQFLKKPNTSEYKAIKKYQLPILIESYGIGFYKILGDNKPKEKHQQAAQKALKRTAELLEKGDFDIVILDEINVAIDYHLIDINEVIEIIGINKKAELILTGRNAHPKLMKLAELVTVMKKHKHYFDKGMQARKGIEY